MQQGVRLDWRLRTTAFVLVSLVSASVASAQSVVPEQQITVPAVSSFDGEPFVYTMRHLRDDQRHRVFALRYPSPVVSEVAANNLIPAEYYVPLGVEGDGVPRPAVICLHILNGDFELVRLLCTVLADRGIPAIFFKLPYYGERGGPDGRGAVLGDVRRFVQALSQGMADIRRTVDMLASRPEVDGNHVGISGISLGAILAGAACGVDPRLSRAQLILGGGDLAAILGHAREARALRRSLEELSAAEQAVVHHAMAAVDPLTHVEALRDLAGAGRLAMVNAGEDEVIPKACTERLAAATGMTDRVEWLDGLGHYSAMAALPRIVRSTADFFAQDLPAGTLLAEMPDADGLPPLQTLAGCVQQVVSLMAVAPPAGQCHRLALTAAVSRNQGDTKRFSVDVIRGHAGRFRLEAAPVPEVRVLRVGSGRHPWMQARDGTVFVGTAAGADEATLAELLDPQLRMQVQVLVGALMALTLAPEAFRQYVEVSECDADAGERCLSFRIVHKRLSAAGILRLRRPDMIPLRMTVDVEKTRADVTFAQLSLNGPAPDGLFAEPAGKHQVDVSRQDLLRMFAATLQFAVEKIQ